MLWFVDARLMVFVIYLFRFTLAEMLNGPPLMLLFLQLHVCFVVLLSLTFQSDVIFSVTLLHPFFNQTGP